MNMLTVSPEMTELENGSLSLIRIGQGKELIFFIHGLGCAKESFSYAWRDWQIPENYTICVVDLPGHGASVFPASYPYTMAAYAETCSQLLNFLGADAVHVVGHSMGGAIGLLLSQEGNLFYEDCTISRRIIAYDEQSFIKNVLPLSGGVFKCRSEATSADPLPKALYQSAAALVEISKTGELQDIFMNLPIPKRYVYGERSANPAMVQKLDFTETKCISGAGHFMMQDNPSDTYAVILSCLNNKHAL